jgi:hypothetical protein
MIIPNLILRSMAVDLVNRPLGESVDLVCSLGAEFISAIEFSLIATGLLCPVSPDAIHATIDDGGRLIGAGLSGSELFAVANTTLLPDPANPRPSATVSSWQWIT